MKEIPDANQPVRPVRIEYAESPRLRRIRFLARLLDQSIILPGGYRIGLDPLIGLIPAVGDLIGAAFSLYIVYEAARLGLAKRVLVRMCGNILMEALVGEIPILGDIFDAVWKSNVRNVRLVEFYHHPAQPERPAGNIFLVLTILFFALAAVSVSVVAGLVWFILSFFSR